jgi:hypothetical protein
VGNVFAKAAEWLARMRKRHAVTPVVYRREGEAIQIDAQKLSVTVELDRGDGVVIEAQRTDWIVAVCDLVFGGRRVEPAEGDLIEQILGTTTYKYEVMPLGTEGHFRPLDPHGQSWRIHTKLVSVQ